MNIQHRMTSKAQVTVPKDIRTALGVKPGDLVRFESDAEGHVTLSKGDEEETAEVRRERVRAALNALRGKYPNPGGMSTDEYMRWLRGDWEP
jgi:AbrB family looped-hinge helix DNA binding protein